MVGPEPDADAEKIESTVAQFRDVVSRLGKPTGRRVALAEPAVILPRAAALAADESDESDEDDGT